MLGVSRSLQEGVEFFSGEVLYPSGQTGEVTLGQASPHGSLMHHKLIHHYQYTSVGNMGTSHLTQPLRLYVLEEQSLAVRVTRN